MPVVLTGGTTEWEQKLCSEIAEGMSGVINLGGKTSLRGLMAVAALAEVVFTVDGFVSHLAAAFKRPCMTLFGPTNVNHWHASSPLTCAVFPGDAPGAYKGRKMADITTQVMLARTESWLKEINFQA
jgi:heptosyltransferase-3